MSTAQEKFDRQNEQLTLLLNERSQMAQKVEELERQDNVEKQQAAEISYLREV